MKSHQERAKAVHQRARQLKQRQEKTVMGALTAGAAGLFLSLLLVIFYQQPPGVLLSGSSYAGSSMLGEGTGGYVLIALLAFAAGVLVTILCRKYLDFKNTEKDETQE